jgi:hypothetical protein
MKRSAPGYRNGPSRAIVAAIVLAASLFAGEWRAEAEEAAAASPDLVLVLDCQAEGNYASAGRTVTGIVVAAVGSGGKFAAVSPESRDKALQELAFSLSDLAAAPLREKIGSLTSARYVLSSKISPGEGELFLAMTLVDVASGTIAGGATESYRSVGTLIDGAEGQTLRCLGLQAPDDERKILLVKNATELIKAIGPDRIIRLAPGRYDLTDKFLVKNRYVDWVDEFDGPCPVVKNVSNLALIGDAGPAGRAEIVIAPAYGWVFSFETCSGLRISSLVLGHTTPGYCLGGVLGFTRCDDVEIRSCELYGSGTYGLGLERTQRFSIVDSVVRDCSYGLATIDRCEDLLFASTTFKGTGEFDLLDIRASIHLLFRDCEFSRNRGDSLFSIDGESRDCRALSCRFLDNDVARFSAGRTSLGLEGATFKGNKFGKP